MRNYAYLAFVGVLVVPFVANARPNTTAMTCAEGQATVDRAGAVVLSTGGHTYDRFVAAIKFCAMGEDVEPGVAPTRDSRRCQVGYVCRPRDMGDDR